MMTYSEAERYVRSYGMIASDEMIDMVREAYESGVAYGYNAGYQDAIYHNSYEEEYRK